MKIAGNGNQPRQGILSLSIKDKGALYNAYMSFVNGGGLFIPTQKGYRIGDEVFILLRVMDEHDKLPVSGKVAWVTPAGAQGGRPAGIGVQFTDNHDGQIARSKIETHLAGSLKAERATQTM